jgi:aspartate aminotransferase
MFRDLANYTDDPIEGMFARLSADNNPAKIDLGIGVYRDESGKVPVMQAVRKAEQILVDRNLPKSYITPFGNLDYCRDIERLVLGKDHAVIGQGRIVSAQTPGAGCALRLGAEIVHDLSPASKVWASTPVWFHQLEFFEKAGLEVAHYRYYDREKSRPEFDGMLEDLGKMRAGDILLLHGCCHNPTGHDLSPAEWQAVTDVVLATGAIPFIDIAYQGFGQGIDEDVLGTRLMLEQVPQALLTVSSSKSFGVYRDRAGMLSIITPGDAADVSSVRRKLRDSARQLYFMAPDHAAAVVHEILSSPALETLWRDELDELRGNITLMRGALRKILESENPGFDAGFIEQQFGMFSCLPISDAEQRMLEDEYHIYMLPDARMNVAAMSAEQAVTVARAFRDIRERRA